MPLSQIFETGQQFVLSPSMQMALWALEMPIAELALSLGGSVGTGWNEDVEAKPSLFEHLMLQARCSFSDEQELADAEWIIGSLDERGFFTDSDDRVSKTVLEKVQLFDPPGIAASSLRTSLLVQLKALGKSTTLAYHIIDRYFDAFLHSKWHKIPYPKQDVHMAVEKDIRFLKMRPAEDFAHTVSVPIVPDLIVERHGTRLDVVVNDEGLPADMPSWVFKRQTMLKVLGMELIQRQRAYFLGGEHVPMTMTELSYSLGVHLSTVTRAVSGKYILSPQGFILIRHLFSSAVDAGVSSSSVKKAIENFVKAEDKAAPLSDADLALKIAELGVRCSRRVVAKYRKALRIPSSYERSKECI